MIELRNVTKIYKNGKEALSGLNLTINTGEICFIVGESGAGKDRPADGFRQIPGGTADF